jgi:hypothetical protein
MKEPGTAKGDEARAEAGMKTTSKARVKPASEARVKAAASEPAHVNLGD